MYLFSHTVAYRVCYKTFLFFFLFLILIFYLFLFIIIIILQYCINKLFFVNLIGENVEGSVLSHHSTCF